MNYSDAEKWLIGGLLINPENMDKVRLWVSRDDFLDSAHRKIYDTIEELHDREDIPLDLSTIYSFLKEEGDNEFKIARHIEGEIPTDINLEYWAKTVRRGSLERQIKIQTSQEEIDLNKIETIIEKLKGLNQDISIYKPITEIPPPSEEQRGSRIKTGLVDLDKNLKFALGNLMVISGKTGQGKTSLGLGILNHINEERPVGVISIEMTGEEVRERVENSFNILPEQFFVADPPALSTSELKHICKSMKSERGVEVILVDYLQLMREREDFRSRHLEVSHIIRKIKEIAKELKIGMIAISQLSRGIDHRGEGSLPSLSDLKESGDIEYAAESILFIHQPHKGDEDYRGENVRLLIIAKNRWGPTGKIKVYWNESKTKFGNYQEESSYYQD